MLLVAAGTFTLAVPASAGAAVSCSDYDPNHFGATWFDYPGDNHVGGVRAGVQLRRDGSVCENGGTAVTGVANWIGLEGDLNQGLVQLGIYHRRDLNGVAHFCKFKEVLPGPPHSYDCSLDDGSYVFFEISKYHGSDGTYVEGDDCGVSDPTYSSCTTEFAGIPDSTIPYDLAEAISETQAGGCLNQIMGDDSNKANIGNAAHGVQVERDFGDPWITPTLEPYSQDGANKCSHFQKDLPYSDVVTFEDDRNVS